VSSCPFLSAGQRGCSTAETAFLNINRGVKCFMNLAKEPFGPYGLAYMTERENHVFVGWSPINEAVSVLRHKRVDIWVVT